MNDKVYVSEPKRCDFCGAQAVVDAKTKHGPWANMCEVDWTERGLDGKPLGTGYGQRIIVGVEPERDRKAEFQAALDRDASFDELEEIVGDGDITDFI